MARAYVLYGSPKVAVLPPVAPVTAPVTPQGGAVGGSGSQGGAVGEATPVIPNQASISLSALVGSDGKAGFKIEDTLTAFDATPRFAEIIDVADVNGDGFDDILVSAYGRRSETGGYAEGAVYVVYGSADGFSDGAVNISELSAMNNKLGFVLTGGDNLAISSGLSSIGDINNDGEEDFFFAGHSYNTNSYVIFGKTGTGADTFDASREISPSLAADDGFQITISESTRFAVELGDINGDGFNDFAIASRDNQNIYVVFGKDSANRANLNVANLGATDGLYPSQVLALMWHILYPQLILMVMVSLIFFRQIE